MQGGCVHNSIGSTHVCRLEVWSLPTMVGVIFKLGVTLHKGSLL